MDTRTFRIRTAALLCSLAACALVPAASALFQKVAQPPAIATFSKIDGTGAIVTFSRDDFTTRITGKDTLDGIVINSLPPAETGTLKVAGRDLLCGEGITSESLSTLSFEPAQGQSSTHASFSFIPVFSDYGAGDQSIAVNINLGDAPGGPPLAESLTFETYVDLACTGEFKATDPDGDPVTYSLVEQPKKGKVELLDNSFCYTPLEGKAYSEKFTYCAIDENGNSSNPATVKITVKKQSDKKTIRYADLASSPSHYAAIKLAESGVFSGEQIGKSYFLSPDETVSRGQFIAMVMAAADISLPTAAIPSGLADDAQTPQWAKAACAAAIHAGIVNGSPDGNGSRVLRANDPITRAEAAVILDRAADLPGDLFTETVFADSNEIPAWAAQSVMKTTSAGIVDTKEGALRPNAQLTRAEAVTMIYSALQSESGKNGILELLK